MGVSDVCCERQVNADSAARICSILISVAAFLVCKSVIACTMVDIRSSSMADRNELVECRLLSREEGAWCWEHIESAEPGSEAEKRTMVHSPTSGRSYGGNLFCC